MSKIFCFLLLSFIFPYSFASEWIFFGRNDAGQGRVSEVYFDMANVVPKGKYLKVWVRQDYSQPLILDSRVGANAGREALSSIQLYYFDCAEREIATGGETTFSEKGGKGENLHTYNISFSKIEPHPARPDSSGDVWLDYICKKVSPNVSENMKKPEK
jgi:hypothetical protein